MYFVNEDIKNCVRVFPEQGRYDYTRYDMNENPEGLPQWFVDELLKETIILANELYDNESYKILPLNKRKILHNDNLNLNIVAFAEDIEDLIKQGWQIGKNTNYTTIPRKEFLNRN